ncbi:hypothetical protein JXB12_02760 [candidate division KSB1 bacterium]|nr:hypothetical protein [candidate division KSB1 bacterium]
MKQRIFIKIGGSFITDKTQSDSLKEDRIRHIARVIADTQDSEQYDLLIAHGAGAYGHIQAQNYQAQLGIHPTFLWRAFYQIRMDMMSMNLRFVELAAEQGLNLITVQPSAIIRASNGSIRSISMDTISMLLRYGQIPLVHGDIVVDEVLGFTIASTENILAAIVEKLRIDRVIMISDVPGVLDTHGQLIERIDEANFFFIQDHLRGARGSDVTGGMKEKVHSLYTMIRSGRVNKAFILSCDSTETGLASAIKGEQAPGTVIC